MLFPIQRRTMLEPYVDSGDKVKLLLLHSNTGTTHGLGKHVPTLSASEYQRIRRVVSARRRNDLQRRWYRKLHRKLEKNFKMLRVKISTRFENAFAIMENFKVLETGNNQQEEKASEQNSDIVIFSRRNFLYICKSETIA